MKKSMNDDSYTYRYTKEKHESENSHDSPSEGEEGNENLCFVKLQRIMDWINSGACPVSFDDTTIKGIKEYSEKEYFKGFSYFQEKTINNIYNGYRIEKWFMRTLNENSELPAKPKKEKENWWDSYTLTSRDFQQYKKK